MKKLLLNFLLLLPIALAAQTPVARYTFNNGNAVDEIGSNNGTVSGATLTTDRFGNIDMAYSFNGSNNYITLGDVTEFQFGTDSFAISFWIEFTVTHQGTILAKRDGIATNYQQYNFSVINNVYSGGPSQNVWGFIRNSSSQDRLINCGNLSGAWHHVVLNHLHGDSTSMYVDGVYVGMSNTAFTGSLNVVGEPLVLGYNSNGNNGFYNGKIDDIHIYRTALTTQQIDSLYNLPNPATVGVAKFDSNPAIKTFPNPASEFLFVQLDQVAEFSIYSSIGQLIETRSGSSSYQLDLSSYASGIYIIKSGATSHRFIKP
jgi:hypothetical protein